MRTLSSLTLAAVLSAAAPAYAKSGLYTGLSFGYGALSGSHLVLTESGHDVPSTDPLNCCADPGASAEFRLGFSIGGFFAPEFGFVAHGFDLASSAGGEGFIGGGLRVFPVGLVGLTGLDVKSFPILIGLGGLFGYTVVGKDFAYSGTFFAFDVTGEYIVSELFSIGVRLTIIKPTFGGFAWTDYSGDLGRCLDSSGVMDPMGPILPKSSAVCSGKGPSTLYLSPTLSMTFHFDLIE